MTVETVDTLIIGGGQAGLAMSEHLSNAKVPHLVVERNRIAERWRSERWDSLVANGPAWHDRFPNMTFDDTDPNGFATKTSIVSYFEAYARQINAPIRCGVEVLSGYVNWQDRNTCVLFGDGAGAVMAMRTRSCATGAVMAILAAPRLAPKM